MELKTVFDNHTDRFSGKWKHYFDIYDRYLQRYIGKSFTLLEIGVSNGGSLQIWKKYFGDKVQIVGIDIDPKTMYSESQIQTFCGSQSDPKFLDSVLRQVGVPDVIIDDGSHIQQDVIASFNFLFPILANNGVYIIEDTHTAYWHEWQGGITSPYNFVSIASRFTHDVNLQHIEEPYTPVAKDLKSISFYDSMVIMEKQLLTKKEPCYAGVNRIPGV
jgi:hypothetical protein